MCIAATGRRGSVVVPESLHPEYRQTIATYLSNLDVRLHTVATPDGTTGAELLARSIGDDTACVVIQQPNFFGCVEDLQSLVQAAHERGAMVVAAVDPISLGLLRRPGEFGVDIVVAEGQSLGTPMQFGGPYLGIMACSEKFVRRMPGRIAGQTVDRRGNRCWVLTLQTREQHIRREKATSNICTNQGLFALRATVYLAALGPQGLRETAEACLRKANYARGRLTQTGRLSAAFDAPVFKEFVVRDGDRGVQSLVADALQAGFFAGVPLGGWYPRLSDCLLVTVTEKRTRREIDALANCVSQPNRRQEMVDA
jgi:glycine dehydrogenase subunit 1